MLYIYMYIYIYILLSQFQSPGPDQTKPPQMSVLQHLFVKAAHKLHQYGMAIPPQEGPRAPKTAPKGYHSLLAFSTAFAWSRLLDFLRTLNNSFMPNLGTLFTSKTSSINRMLLRLCWANVGFVLCLGRGKKGT